MQGGGARYDNFIEKSTTFDHAEAFVDPINVPKLGSTSVLLPLNQLQSHDHPQQRYNIDSSLISPCRSEASDSDI